VHRRTARASGSSGARASGSSRTPAGDDYPSARAGLRVAPTNGFIACASVVLGSGTDRYAVTSLARAIPSIRRAPTAGSEGRRE